MSVDSATVTKSWVDIKVSRGGLDEGEEEEVVIDGGGLAHSVVMEVGSREPSCAEDGRVDWIRDGAWISL